MQSSKLFVSNLNTTTTAVTIGKLFESVGIVVNATIEIQDGVSKGYGFVEMNDAATAEQVRRRFNGYNLEGRQIKVEYAREDNQQLNAKVGRGRRGERRGAPRRQQFQRPGGFQRRFGGYYGFPRRGYGMRYPGQFGAPTFRAGWGQQPRFSRQPLRQRAAIRKRRPFDSSAPTSATRIHISNIPFNLKADELQKCFENYKVKEVIVPHQQFNTLLNLGFGYIEFENEEEQKKVLAEHQTIKIQDRECRIHPALIQSTDSKKTSDNSEQKESSQIASPDKQ
ncbi:putative RNA recognition motif protein [Monocercomonoides exilis]|uniref:putative RNA recognition motif protein n=1 Tax=Monocercomonoides exilis TaxID=2049356 RepID=UPI003559FE1C|nr:putative RNA recognition motif protein [Monocercomonoides exilis]|eukprot:MONOS_8886.1-p1 / transcript=MONOS_8886.1 / gene=MONOS_8886 / organism=Monocercomonoides_exilis_PA203 / gene_product=unspecified product / transcript_product=unspecified product / location=Mono_scaffold00348:56668-57627(+) / protein_length=280 / sequence_SO=supercontig / SO=protein_coding / is_pseudo=false